jgi:large subunit ribosomal protein L15
MQINELKPVTPRKKTVLVGRGGKRGKTSGRGTKGQKARAGHKIRPEIRDQIRRVPKLRGRGINSNLPVFDKPVAVTLTTLSAVFKDGDVVSPQSLVAQSVITNKGDKFPKVKIIGGELDKKLVFEGVAFTAGARETVTKVGGTIK